MTDLLPEGLVLGNGFSGGAGVVEGDLISNETPLIVAFGGPPGVFGLDVGPAETIVAFQGFAPGFVFGVNVLGGPCCG